MTLSSCRSCGATTFWVQTDRGKMLLIDADPRLDGNIVVGPDGIARVFVPDGLFTDEDERYTTHWATCPNKEWRNHDPSE